MSMTNAFEALTVEEERREWRAVVKQRARLRAEKSQKSAKWAKDENGFERLEYGEPIRQWTIMNDFYDTKGYNRKGSTFSLLGLKELGVILWF